MNLRDDRGVSALELGLMLPIMALVIAVAIPVISAGYRYMQLNRATAAGIRYASRVDTNPRNSSAGLTRRPTTAEVVAFVTDAASPLTPTAVTVNPEPARSISGDLIEVRASDEINFGAVATIANTLQQILFNPDKPLLPASITVTVSARGREE